MSTDAISDLYRALNAEAVDASCQDGAKPDERARYWVLSAWLVRGEVQSKPRDGAEAVRMGKIALEYELSKADGLKAEIGWALEARSR